MTCHFRMMTCHFRSASYSIPWRSVRAFLTIKIKYLAFFFLKSIHVNAKTWLFTITASTFCALHNMQMVSCWIMADLATPAAVRFTRRLVTREGSEFSVNNSGAVLTTSISNSQKPHFLKSATFTRLSLAAAFVGVRPSAVMSLLGRGFCKYNGLADDASTLHPRHRTTSAPNEHCSSGLISVPLPAHPPSTVRREQDADLPLATCARCWWVLIPGNVPVAYDPPSGRKCKGVE